MGKDKDNAVVDNMNNKYGLVKENRGYNIKSISYQEVCFTAHILVEKIMKK